MEQDELLTHIEFDIGSNINECEEKIYNRVKNAELTKIVPIRWTNREYVIPIVVLFTIVTFLILSVILNCLFCSGRLRRSGPRRELQLE